MSDAHSNYTWTLSFQATFEKNVEKGPTPKKPPTSNQPLQEDPELPFQNRIEDLPQLTWIFDVGKLCLTKSRDASNPFQQTHSNVAFFRRYPWGNFKMVLLFFRTSKVPQTERRLQPRGIMLSSSSNGKPTKYICPKICAKAESRRTWN